MYFVGFAVKYPARGMPIIFPQYPGNSEGVQNGIFSRKQWWKNNNE
jgi:hypothetical protein